MTDDSQNLRRQVAGRIFSEHCQADDYADAAEMQEMRALSCNGDPATVLRACAACAASAAAAAAAAARAARAAAAMPLTPGPQRRDSTTQCLFRMQLKRSGDALRGAEADCRWAQEEVEGTIRRLQQQEYWEAAAGRNRPQQAAAGRRSRSRSRSRVADSALQLSWLLQAEHERRQTEQQAEHERRLGVRYASRCLVN